jgi:hypothetical protein
MFETDVRNGYVEALLWANAYIYVDAADGGEIPDLEPAGSAHLEYDFFDFSDEDKEAIESFVREFIEANAVDYRDYLNGMARFAYDSAETFGHDLLLTRNGHGAGFWDRGLGELGDRLSEAARVYGSTSAEIVNGKPVLVES